MQAYLEVGSDSHLTCVFQVHMGLMAQHSMTTSRATSALTGMPSKPDAAAQRSFT